jgi:hypothetical protein
MATKKISELTPLDPSANLELTFIPVFDDVSDSTRKITLKQINDAVEASIPIAESAYAQANTATTNAATADQKALSAGNYANSAFVRANNSLNVSVGGTITGDMTINGNLTVSGCTASLQVSTLRTNDPVLDLSFGTVGNPTQNAGIRILRGDELPVQVRWNETSDKWQFTNDGTTYTNLGEIIGLDNDFILASSNTANTANLTAHRAYDNSNSSYLLANLNAQLSLANYNSIQAFGNGTGTITITSVTANTLTFGGSLYANAAYDAANTADQRAVTSGNYANSAFGVANTSDQRAVTSGDYANSAFGISNTADQRAVTSGSYANSSYFHANAVFNLANTFTTEASTAGNYANSAFGVANTADQRAVTSGDYANSAYLQANTPSHVANSAGVYANAGYGQANTATTNAAQADQRAVTSGSYANSAYIEANSASSGVIIADQRATTAGSYANSAYLLANVADQRAVTSGSYANSAFGVANTVTTRVTGNVFIDSTNTAIKFTENGSEESYLTLTKFGITSNTQMVLSAENAVTGNNSTILFDKDGSGIVFRLEDTTPVSKNWGFYQNRLTFPDSSEQTTAFTINPTLNVLKINDGVHEQFQSKADATGTVEHDCSFGHIFYHISPDANWTANFTNLNLSSTYVTSVTLIVVQGGTGYYPNAVQIGGVNQTINWQGNTIPTPSTNRTDVVTFSILNTGSGYVVFGQLTGF